MIPSSHSTRVPFNVLFVLTAVLGLSLLSACSDGICRRAKGPIVSEERVLPDFTRFELEGAGQVFIRQDTIQRVIIEVEESLLPVVQTTVSGGLLRVDIDGCVRNEHLTVYLTVVDLESVRIDGSGDIYTESGETLVGQDMNIQINGSGNIEMDLVMDEINTNISGSGDIRLSGTASGHQILIDGSGDIRAYDLPVSLCDIEIRGSGDCRVRVNDELHVLISGSGTVYYKGTPSIIDTEIEGSGSVVNAN